MPGSLMAPMERRPDLGVRAAPGYMPGGPKSSIDIPKVWLPRPGSPLKKSYKDWNVDSGELLVFNEPAIYYQSAT